MAKTRGRLPSAPTGAPQTSTKSAKQQQQEVGTEEARTNTSGEEGSDESSVWRTAVGKKSPKKVKYVCKGGTKVCGQVISMNDDCILCEACDGWFHPSCQNLSNEAFKALGKFDLLWLCDECRKKLPTLLNVAERVERRVAEAEKKIVEAIQKAPPALPLDKNLEEKILNLETEVVKQISAQKEALINSSNDLKKAVQKQGSVSNREHNVIIHNILESDSENLECRVSHDESKFKEVAKALYGDGNGIETEKIIRLGKKNEDTTRPRLMLVKLRDKRDVEKLFRKRFELKDAGFPNTYITKDLEPEEREKQKKLREEWIAKGKDSHRIFRGQVVPRKQLIQE